MDALYNQILHHLDKAFRKLEGMVPSPQKEARGNGFVFRFREKTIHQAMVQKLAREISGLHAVRLLFENGFVQEQAAIQRMLDEFHEDILFLAWAVIKNDQTLLHQRYLDAFYKEEFNDMVPRKKIRSYIARIDSAGDPSTAVTLYGTIHSVYSGFVHGASPQIMELLGGNPPRFQIHGMSGTPLHEDHRYDLYNPFFRAIISFSVAAKAFGDDELCQSLHAYHLEVDSLSGRNEAYRADAARQNPSGESR